MFCGKSRTYIQLLRCCILRIGFHLQRYGRLIYGETYCAMRSGPVPSFAYDIVKAARGDGPIDCQLPIEQSIRVEGNNVAPLRMPEEDFLSESDLECLDESIEEYGSLPPGELKRRSHDKAYNSATENDSILLSSIIDSLDNAAELRLYLYGR